MHDNSRATFCLILSTLQSLQLMITSNLTLEMCVYVKSDTQMCVFNRSITHWDFLPKSVIIKRMYDFEFQSVSLEIFSLYSFV